MVFFWHFVRNFTNGWKFSIHNYYTFLSALDYKFLILFHFYCLIHAFGPLGEGAGLRPAGEGAPNPRSLPMQAAPLVATDVFTMLSLSIGVRSSAGVARGFWPEGWARAGAIEQYPRDSAHAECPINFSSLLITVTPTITNELHVRRFSQLWECVLGSNSDANFTNFWPTDFLKFWAQQSWS